LPTKRIVFKNPGDPPTWNLSENAYSISVQTDDQGNVIALPAFLINPQKNPIVAGGNIGNVVLQDNTTNTLARIAVFGGTPSQEDLSTLGALLVANESYLYDQATGKWDMQEEATSSANANASGAASTQLVAAVAAKAYRLFSITLQAASSTGTGTCTVNEATSGAVLAGVSLLAAGQVGSVQVNFGPNGILQPNVNNAIQVTSLANMFATATLVYGAAR
jgi:hypothetical protein